MIENMRTAIAAARVKYIRAVRINGLPQLMTRDLKWNRMNVEIYNNIIVKVVSFF